MNTWPQFLVSFFAVCGPSHSIQPLCLLCISTVNPIAPAVWLVLQGLRTHTQIVVDLAQLGQNRSCDSGFICASPAHTVCCLDEAKALDIRTAVSMDTAHTSRTNRHVSKCNASLAFLLVA